MLTTFLAIVPIFLIMGAGYIVRRTKLAPESWVSVLNQFVYIVALPALIIGSLLGIKWDEAGLGTMILVGVALSISIGMLLALILPLTKWKLSTQATVFVLCLLGNTIFLGIPVALALHPNISFSTITMLGTVQFLAGLLISLIGLELRFSKRASSQRLMHTLITNPLTIAFGIGLLLSAISPVHRLTEQLSPTLKLLAATASPLALFSLGMFWRGHSWKTQFVGPIGTVLGLKLLLMPFSLLFIAQQFSLTGELLELTILLAAMPPAVTAFVLAKRYQLDAELVALAITVTTIVSLITLPAISTLMSRS